MICLNSRFRLKSRIYDAYDDNDDNFYTRNRRHFYTLGTLLNDESPFGTFFSTLGDLHIIILPTTGDLARLTEVR